MTEHCRPLRELIDDLRRVGVHFELVNGTVIISTASGKAVCAAVQDFIDEHREAVRAVLKAEQQLDVNRLRFVASLVASGRISEDPDAPTAGPGGTRES